MIVEARRGSREGAGRPAAEAAPAGLRPPASPRSRAWSGLPRPAIASWRGVARAEEQVREVTSIIEIQSRERPKKIEVPCRAHLEPELEIFTGDEYDRKAVVGHRKFVEQEKARLKSEAEAYEGEEECRKEGQAGEQAAPSEGDWGAPRREGPAHESPEGSGEGGVDLVDQVRGLHRNSAHHRQGLAEGAGEEKALAEKKRLREEEKEQNRLRREREMEERRRAKEVANLERRFPLEDSARRWRSPR